VDGLVDVNSFDDSDLDLGLDIYHVLSYVVDYVFGMSMYIPNEYRQIPPASTCFYGVDVAPTYFLFGTWRALMSGCAGAYGFLALPSFRRSYSGILRP
jgi:hypothetical protein